MPVVILSREACVSDFKCRVRNKGQAADHEMTASTCHDRRTRDTPSSAPERTRKAHPPDRRYTHIDQGQESPAAGHQVPWKSCLDKVTIRICYSVNLTRQSIQARAFSSGKELDA